MSGNDTEQWKSGGDCKKCRRREYCKIAVKRAAEEFTEWSIRSWMRKRELENFWRYENLDQDARWQMVADIEME